MNRRNFFRRFGGLIASVAIAQKVVAELCLSTVATAKITLSRVINPEWLSAKYEAVFFRSGGAGISQPLVLERNADHPNLKALEQNNIVFDPYPNRFNNEGKFVQPFITKGVEPISNDEIAEMFASKTEREGEAFL